MLKVISFKICPFVQRVTALLEAKNIAYGIDYISLNDKPQWFLDIAPNGQVPVLITESGIALYESDAIAEYLDEVYPPLESDISPEQRAIDRAWSYQATKHYLAQCSAMRSPDKDSLTERTVKLDKAFAKAEASLGETLYFKGPAISNVDIAWLPLLHRAEIISRYTGYDFLSKFPQVKAWQQALLNTGLMEKSVATDFENLFSNFYLSEQTFLGKDRCQPGSAHSACSPGCC